MYLSTKQHDQLQILVTGFEIPFRSFVAIEILNRYPSLPIFSADLMSRTPPSVSSTDYKIISSQFGRIKKDPASLYRLLTQSKTAKENRIVPSDINVPDVATVITLTIIYREIFPALLLNYNDESTYLQQALRYKYVRNKLDHRGCKTLEIPDMTVSLEFMANALLCLNNDLSLFWDKSYDAIAKELAALQSAKIEIPVEINNIQDMPFPDMRIVCRDQEVQQLKSYVYGVPGALRKQASLVLFGYGGVGKTALVLEAIKQIVQDLQDNTTINGYQPDFMLFFTAKEEALGFSKTTGKIENRINRYTFRTAAELKNNIFNALGVTSFSNYKKSGLIVIDNLETVSAEDRKEIEDFVNFYSPQQIQYIITSRNEEHYENSKKLAGFEDEVSGKEFINTYIEENNFALELDDDDVQSLLKISAGNTLVLVLCLRRLSLNLTTVSGIETDMSAPVRLKKITSEMQQIPANGFSIISEYMFKNSFEEIQASHVSNEEILTRVLQIFAVYPSEAIDPYTISMLSQQPYSMIDPILDLLCRYLIVEKIGETYSLNQFARKYIIQLFLPDSETRERIASEIEISTRKIQEELGELKRDISRNNELKRIINDWRVVADGDKIAVAKAYRLYGDVKRDCESGGRFHVSTALDEAVKTIDTLEQNTMHPYIKFQKARILQLIRDSKILDQDFTQQISKAYNDTIWTIKANPIYYSIKETKSFASVLWFYGIELRKGEGLNAAQNAARYLEESVIVFEQIGDSSKNYYQCLTMLGETYLDLYLIDRQSNLHYLRKARSVSNKLYDNRGKYSGLAKTKATDLRSELQKYGRF